MERKEEEILVLVQKGQFEVDKLVSYYIEERKNIL